MIQYSLKCASGHSFESWFKSSDAYDSLKAAGHVSCAVCGSIEVEKGIMAPHVGTSRTKQPDVPQRAAEPTQSVAKVPEAQMRQLLAEMKRQVEANSDYVGKNFVKEARAMHLGDAPERAIYGEAKPAEAKALIDEGVPVMPLPFTPTRKTN
ncbi:DUF1178 family protein [Aliishimia ponticola]|uniref:DUF1178 family protein n=1 Tax=Aliishimia ponticola TaxID=2499833 RepID=A0A4S4NM32_9RHOB|nr:DUF1178 family protein [Aliishimia ponticola]THH37270.1 DUF1178 family protein [Aliishimia ponticola]